MIQALEDAVVNRLADPLLAMGAKVLPLPDTENLPRPTQSAQVFVAYLGAKFSGVQSFNSGQTRTLQIEIIVQVKGLRTHQGAYSTIEKILGLLTNFQPFPREGYMMPDYDRFMEVDQGIWTYVLGFSVSVTYFGAR